MSRHHPTPSGLYSCVKGNPPSPMLQSLKVLYMFKVKIHIFVAFSLFFFNEGDCLASGIVGSKNYLSFNDHVVNV